MRFQNSPLPIRSSSLRALILVLGFLGIAFSANSARAANPVVKDGNTIQLGELTYRLDGIDAPELDQMCIDDHADPWTCGVDARDQLTKLIGGHPVHCDDQGPAKGFRKRHIGVCTVTGETASLNQLLVRQGFALNLEPSAKGRFVKDQADAKDGRRGMWKGCFVSPQEFRHGKKDGALLGGSCRADKDREIRAALFPEDLAMPSGCAIKAKFAVRARVTGNVGIYHLQGCRSYPALTKPDRWFCSEDDAQAAGFRRAYNCRASAVKK
ncbi:thermonuclease family protein [Bradyrhizobium canariense]|uniref:Endonuclease YncB, thermonuclease family n=1 Tax=Bradyrhizobium canariense TaxID=255045 RepID=A0A1H1RQ93_9BRAD|nr:thermonuclease family protein [Bradyrhizobium canariense]SDS37888.1 Endonuclease YncB, thermonuclease family [Bradyrhizobium canariense]